MYLYLHFAAGVSPVIPALGDDDVVHPGVGEDDPRKGTPRPSEIERPRARDLAVEEREPRVVQHAAPPLSRQCARVLCYRVHVTTLHPN